MIDHLAPKLIFLQEIWLPYSEEAAINRKFPDYTVQISTPDQFTHPEDPLGHPSHTWHGAAILWHETLDHNVTTINNVHERFTAVKVATEEQTILVISAYMPTSGKDNEYTDCLGELAIFIDDNSETGTTILIGMDSNCSDNSTKRRSSNLNQFCEDHDLVKIMAPVPTFHHTNAMVFIPLTSTTSSYPSPAQSPSVKSPCSAHKITLRTYLVTTLL